MIPKRRAGPKQMPQAAARPTVVAREREGGNPLGPVVWPQAAARPTVVAREREGGNPLGPVVWVKALLSRRKASPLDNPRARALAQLIAERTVTLGKRGRIRVVVAIDQSWSMDGWLEAALAAAEAMEANAETRIAVWAEKAAYVTEGLFGGPRVPHVGDGTFPSTILGLPGLAATDLLVVITDGEFTVSASGEQLIGAAGMPIDWVLTPGGTDSMIHLRDNDRLLHLP